MPVGGGIGQNGARPIEPPAAVGGGGEGAARMEPRAAWGAVVLLAAVSAAGLVEFGGGGPPPLPCTDGELVELRGRAEDGFGPSRLVCRQELPAALEVLGCGAVVPGGRAVAVGEGCRPAPASATASLLLGRPVDVNTATAEDLEALPGIGSGLARRIVASRERDGPFGGLSDLRRVKGLGPSRIRALAGWAVAAGDPTR
jgi:competence ComEA-like helix-hairpin-helix protein